MSLPLALLLALAPVAAAPRLGSHTSFLVMSSPYDPAALRHHYERAAADKAAGESFYQLLVDYHAQDALVLGYKAAAQAIRARDASMFNKLTYVQDAAKTFEQAVSIDPQNPEIRFLRFSVESNLPPFWASVSTLRKTRRCCSTLRSNTPAPALMLKPSARYVVFWLTVAM